MATGPELARDGKRVHLPVDPPGSFIAMVVQLAMVQVAERHGELVADFAAQGIGLGEGQMMGMARQAATDQAGLVGHEFQVVQVAQPPGFRPWAARFCPRTAMAWGLPAGNRSSPAMALRMSQLARGLPMTRSIDSVDSVTALGCPCRGRGRRHCRRSRGPAW